MGHRVYTGGTFDCFHAGHVNFLRQCRALAGTGGEVVVSLNTDEFIQAYKDRPPVIPYESRMAVLATNRFVDRVIPNTGGADSKPAILSVMPDIVAIGDDWCGKDYYAQMGFDQAWLDNWCITLVYVPRFQGISTTSIREQL